jgi:hypothetical protein
MDDLRRKGSVPNRGSLLNAVVEIKGDILDVQHVHEKRT